MVSTSAGAPTRSSTSEVLAALDKDFEALSEGVAAGQYAFWVGSGISLQSVPGLEAVLLKALSFLQARHSQADPDCPYGRAIVDMLRAAGISSAQIQAIDLGTPLSSWPDLDDLLARLQSAYSAVLEVVVEGEEAVDFLLWDAIDVRGTYADPSLEPSTEHLCLAILILEGAVRVAASANWDGLIEASLRSFGADENTLRVLVHPDEFREGAGRADLIKFHGCAVRADEDPDRFRNLLVARKSQIAGWADNPSNAVALNAMTQLVATRPTLMIGLSAQDADIQGIFSRAQTVLAWHWPTSPTAVVFAEEAIGNDQRVILQLVYGSDYHPNRDEIDHAARLGAYSRPLLVALVLTTLEAKLTDLLQSTRFDHLGVIRDDLRSALRRLRDRVGAESDHDPLDFVAVFARSMSLFLAIFRHGVVPSDMTRYEPLSGQPIRDLRADPNVQMEPLEYLAALAGLLALGEDRAVWTLVPGDPADPNAGACRLVSGTTVAKTFVVQDSGVLARSEAGGLVDMSDPSTLVLHASSIPGVQQRTPAAVYGRTGSSGAREVAVSDLFDTCGSTTELVDRFRAEAGL
jgi:hypothetical protein